MLSLSLRRSGWTRHTKHSALTWCQNGTYYCLDYGTLFDTGLRLSKEKNLTTIRPKKVYDTKELQSFDLFCGSKTILKEWYRAKDAVLTYYVGKNYDKQF